MHVSLLNSFETAVRNVVTQHRDQVIVADDAIFVKVKLVVNSTELLSREEDAALGHKIGEVTFLEPASGVAIQNSESVLNMHNVVAALCVELALNLVDDLSKTIPPV